MEQEWSRSLEKVTPLISGLKLFSNNLKIALKVFYALRDPFR